jgi:hypothetical protein
MSGDDNEERLLKKLTVRELRARAVKSLGSKVAAGLKLKQELVDALIARAEKIVAPKRAAARAAKAATKAASEVRAAPAKAAAAKAAAPKKSPPAPAPKKRAAAPKAVRASPPPKAEPASSAEPVMQVYELPVTRDFFVDPRRPSLPSSYGDDRLLCFRREPLAVVVSWDLSPQSFGDGQGLALELITAKGRLAGTVSLTTPSGLATFETLPRGTALTVQVVRKGRVLTRAKPFMLGPAADEEGEAQAWEMTVAPGEALPRSPVRRPWSGEAPGASQDGQAAHATSSRLGPAQTPKKVARPSSQRVSS